MVNDVIIEVTEQQPVTIEVTENIAIIIETPAQQGIQGAKGDVGATGVTGAGVASGGTTGQFLTKIDATDYNTQWSAPTTANIPDSSNKRYVTDAQLTVISNTSGANTGDETQSTILSKLGYTPENVANKATDFTTINNTLYPSVQAANNAINTATSNNAITGKLLTGFVSGAGIVVATDSILQAFNKIIGNISALVTGVSSVFGRTGAVTATNGDYTASQITNVAAGSISSITVQTAINELDSEKLAITAFTDANISISDINTNNATTTQHGFLPKLSGSSAQYLNGVGAFATPSSGVINSYLEVAFTSQTSVVVTHNFGARPVVSVIDNTNSVLIPESITHNSVNQFTVTFSYATTGNIQASIGSPPLSSYTSVSASYSITVNDKYVEVTTSGNTLTLPTAVGVAGKEYSIDNSSSGNNTLATTSSQTIQGSLTQTIPSQSAITVVSNGTNWRVK